MYSYTNSFSIGEIFWYPSFSICAARGRAKLSVNFSDSSNREKGFNLIAVFNDLRPGYQTIGTMLQFYLGEAWPGALVRE